MKLRNLLALGTFGLASLVGGCQEVNQYNKTIKDSKQSIKEIHSMNLSFEQDLQRLNLKLEKLHEMADQRLMYQQEVQRLKREFEFYERVNQPADKYFNQLPAEKEAK
ncbi:MAG: hypothetical protein KJ939_06920 [Nanoarchaeota archaeon]|nr:hypothetical protein [Nanoarchaeota archaeon]